MKSNNLSDILNTSITGLIKDAWNIAVKNPRLAASIMRMLNHQKKNESLRQEWAQQGVQVPPFMILSVTSQCNLMCAGCYEKAHTRPKQPNMSTERLTGLLNEARDLGVTFVLIAGGEPLMRKDLLPVLCSVPEIIFPIFTNGVLIDDNTLALFEKNPHLVPMLSLEGQACETDARRGEGMYAHVLQTIAALHKRRIFFGTSITITHSNFDLVTGPAYVEQLIASGCSVFIFVEYIPVESGTENWILSEEQNQKLHGILDAYRKKYPALFVGFPGDEEQFGGCLSAGRGFVHISASGRVEPCPFAPYSDTAITTLPLADALQSELLQKIRNNHEELSETKGGCALWDKRDWVRGLLG